MAFVDPPSIWEDPDVRLIYEVQDGQPFLRFNELDGSDALLVELFISKDSVLDDNSSVDALAEACLAGISAVERFSDEVSIGWHKFICYRVGAATGGLWELRGDQRAARYGDWVVRTINQKGWGPDGNTSPLGILHSTMMATASQAGGGVRLNPASGQFEAPTGDEAREEASVWYVNDGVASLMGWDNE